MPSLPGPAAHTGRPAGPGTGPDQAEAVRRLRHPGALQQGQEPSHPVGHHHPRHPSRAGRDHRRQRNPRPRRPRSSFGFGTPAWDGRIPMITTLGRRARRGN